LPLLPLSLQGLELREWDAELSRIPTHLVQRDEPGVPVVRGVLDPLGHGRAAELLHPHRQLVVMIMQPRAQQDQGAGQIGPPPGSRTQRLVEALDTLGQVGPVDVEGHGHLAKRLGRVWHVRHERGHPPPLGRQQGGDHHSLALLDVLVDRAKIASEPLVELGQRGLVIMVEKDPVHLPHRVVARGSGHRPAVGEPLAGLEDLLHRDPRVGRECAKPVQVAGRIGQPVRVVDA
jgi:hypothetical protein